jgi:hypothetical protein
MLEGVFRAAKMSIYAESPQLNRQKRGSRAAISAYKRPASNEPSMPMKKSVPAANPDAYVAALDGWRRECVELLRKSVLAAATLEEVIKWGHLVYFANGPVLLIRAEEARVLFGFWRGQRLREMEPRLKGGGKYEMATVELREGDAVSAKVVRQLVREAVAVNRGIGDPTIVAKRTVKRVSHKGTKGTKGGGK